MSKIGTVFKFETVRQLKKPSFWISLLLMPLLIFVIIGLSAVSGAGADNFFENASSLDGQKVGLTNESDLFPTLAQDLKKWFSSDDFEEKPTLTLVDSKSDGIGRLLSGELDVYYYLASDARTTLSANVYRRAESAVMMADYGVPLSDFIGRNTIDSLPEDQQIAIYGLIQFGQIDLDENGESKNLIGEMILPILVLAIFYILICVFGNRLSMSLVEEKENRISEMILTAVAPKKVVLGKILSLIALGFIQIAVFVVPILTALIIYRDSEPVVAIMNLIVVDPGTLISNILLLLVSYFFLAGALTFVGTLVPTARDASSYSGVVVILMVMPLFFISDIVSNEPSIVTYLLSYFPFSAPIALMMRNAFGALPLNELIIGISELAICSAGILSLTVKSFQKNAINFSVVKPNFKPRKSWKK